jgi:hypothetical protein
MVDSGALHALVVGRHLVQGVPADGSFAFCLKLADGKTTEMGKRKADLVALKSVFTDARFADFVPLPRLKYSAS